MVATQFMHIREESVIVPYTVITSLVFLLLFFAAVAPDVMNDRGTNWVKGPGWQTPSGAPGTRGHVDAVQHHEEAGHHGDEGHHEAADADESH